MRVFWGNHLGPRPGLWAGRSRPWTKLSMAIFNSFCLTGKGSNLFKANPEKNYLLCEELFEHQTSDQRQDKTQNLPKCRFDSINTIIGTYMRARNMTILVMTKRQPFSIVFP